MFYKLSGFFNISGWSFVVQEICQGLVLLLVHPSHYKFIVRFLTVHRG